MHVDKISIQLSARTKKGLPSNIVVNPKNDAYFMKIINRSCKNVVEVDAKSLDAKSLDENHQL